MGGIQCIMCSYSQRASSHSIGQLFHTPSRSTHQSGEGTWEQQTVRLPRATVAEAANSTKSPSTNTGLLNGKMYYHTAGNFGEH